MRVAKRATIGTVVALLTATSALAGCTEQSLSPSASPLTPTSSETKPSATPTSASSYSATGEVPFAGGRWALYIPASWGKSPSEDAILSVLPDGVEIVGIWQTTESPEDLAFVGLFPDNAGTDDQFEAVATNSSAGIKIAADDSSTSEPEWSTTPGGYRRVTVVTNAVFEDGSTGTQVGSVVVLGDSAIYMVSTSFEPHFGAIGAATTIANSIE